MKNVTIFNRSGCLTGAGMELYLAGRLSHAEKERAGKHLEDCGFCSDALEGLQQLDPSQVRADIASLNVRIDRYVRSVSKQSEKWAWLAAASILLFLGSSVFLVFRSGSEQERMVLAEKTPVELKSTEPGNYKVETPVKETKKLTSHKSAPVKMLLKTEQQAKEDATTEAESVGTVDDFSDADKTSYAWTAEKSAPAPESVSASPATPGVIASGNELMHRSEKFDISGMLAYAEPVNTENGEGRVSGRMKSMEKKEMVAPMNAKVMKSEAFEGRGARANALDGVTLYRKQEYGMAEKAFEEVLAVNPSDHDACLYSILTRLRLERPEEALRQAILLEKTDAGAGKFLQAAALLKAGRQEEALTRLKELAAEPGNRYHDKAEEVLLQLR